MTIYCMHGVYYVCAACSAEGTDLIYLKGEEVAGNHVYLYI